MNLPDGQMLPKGAILTGHVVDSQSLMNAGKEHVAEKPSVLSIRFDNITGKDVSMPVNVSVRAFANDVEAEEASEPQYYDGKDKTGFVDLVGGDSIYLPQTNVLSPDDSIVGHENKQGVFAQLTSNFYVSDDSIWRCDGTDSEQAIGILSPRACGVYGFDTVYMPANGSDGSGVFTLKSLHETIRLHEQSAALLQVNKPQEKDHQGL